MFSSGKSNKNDTSKSKTPSSKPASSNGLNSLVQGTSIEGTVRSSSDIRIDGVIKGNLDCTSKVIIGPTGEVIGEIKCKNAVIEGKFNGHLFVDELLNIREKAHIEGEISTGKLIVQSGAVFNVSCVMGGKKTNFGNSAVSPTKPSNPKDSGKTS